MLRASKMPYKNNLPDFFQRHTEWSYTGLHGLEVSIPILQLSDALSGPTVILWLRRRFWMACGGIWGNLCCFLLTSSKYRQCTGPGIYSIFFFLWRVFLLLRLVPLSRWSWPKGVLPYRGGKGVVGGSCRWQLQQGRCLEFLGLRAVKGLLKVLRIFCAW